MTAILLRCHLDDSRVLPDHWTNRQNILSNFILYHYFYCRVRVTGRVGFLLAGLSSSDVTKKEAKPNPLTDSLAPGEPREHRIWTPHRLSICGSRYARPWDPDQNALRTESHNASCIRRVSPTTTDLTTRNAPAESAGMNIFHLPVRRPSRNRNAASLTFSPPRTVFL